MLGFLKRITIFAFVALVLVACGSAVPEQPEPDAPDAPAPTLEADGIANGQEAQEADLIPAVEQENNTLVVWVPEVINPGAETAGTDALITMLAQFDEANPEIEVIVEVKRLTGDGSMLSYMRSAPAVAPTVVPDIVLLDRSSLITAQQEELLVPIETLVEPEVITDLYPIAVEMGTVDGTHVGLTYLLNTDHLIYRTTFFPSRAPNNYDAVLGGLTGFAFPAGPLSDINRTTLTQYIAAGGRLIDENGTPVIDVDVLTEVLAFYADGKRLDVIDTSLFQIADTSETLLLYRDRQVTLAEVNARDYLLQRDSIPNTSATSTPTADGEPFTLVTGWSWAVATQDPARQERATLFLNFLMNPVVHGTYTLNAGWIPAQSTALEVWGDDDPYVAFADELMQHSEILPSQAVRSVTGEAIQQAVEQVLLNDTLPVQAANQAAAAVSPTEVQP